MPTTARKRVRKLIRRRTLLARLRRLDRLQKRARAPIVYGNRVTVLETGESAYAAMQEAIAAARHGIAVEMYTWADDRAGREFADLVADRARAGVPTRVLLDAFGSFGSDRIAERMRRAGVEVHWYHPIAPWAPSWYPTLRNHRKIVIVDGIVGFAGGMNIGEEYTAKFSGPRAWRDLFVRVEGPAVRELVRVFLDIWLRAGGTPDAAGDLATTTHEVGRAGVQVVGRVGLLGRRALRRAHLALIRGARDRVFIANAYFAPERALKRALMGAAGRGVRVELLLPRETDVPLLRWAARGTYGSLLRSGVRIREHRGAVLHAKAAVFDARILLTGSANLDYRSFRHNVEVAVNVFDRVAAKDALSGFERDWDRAEEITLETWAARGTGERLKERFAALLRYWL